MRKFMFATSFLLAALFEGLSLAKHQPFPKQASEPKKAAVPASIDRLPRGDLQTATFALG